MYNVAYHVASIFDPSDVTVRFFHPPLWFTRYVSVINASELIQFPITADIYLTNDSRYNSIFSRVSVIEALSHGDCLISFNLTEL